MRAQLVRHDKITDELGNTIEIKIWKTPKSEDKPHGFKYSLAYIVRSERVIGYDNAEIRGDHSHINEKIKLYKFTGLKKLTKDFYKDIERFKKGVL